MSITGAQLIALEQAYIGATGDSNAVASLPAALGVTPADVATLASAFYGASPQQLVVIGQARALSKNWATLSAAQRSADIGTYTNAAKASPPTSFLSSDLHSWLLSNA